VFRGIIWDRVVEEGAVPSSGESDSYSEYRVAEADDNYTRSLESPDEEARRFQRFFYRRAQQQTRQPGSRLWNPDGADDSIYDEGDDYTASEDFFTDEYGSDTYLSHRSERDSDFEGHDGHQIKTSSERSIWSEDSSQYETETDDSVSEQSQSLASLTGLEQEEWSSSEVGIRDDLQDEDQEGSGSELEVEDVSRKRSRWSEDESDSEREWSEPSEDTEMATEMATDGCKEEEQTGQLSTTSFDISADDSDSHSTPNLADFRWEPGPKIIDTGNQKKVIERRDHRHRSASDDSTASFEYEYSSDADAQHTRKRFALSQCRVLTLSDRTKGYLRDPAKPWHIGTWEVFHSHDILHNGKAHLLFLNAATLRILPTPRSHHCPAVNTGYAGVCDERHNCPFVKSLSVQKVVHRNIGKVCRQLHGGEDLDELVLFLPFGGWSHSYLIDHHADILSSISTARAKSCKLVFGPYVQRGVDPDYLQSIVYHRPAVPQWEFHEFIGIIRAALVGREKLTIFGLERVKVSRGRQHPYFFDWGEAFTFAAKWDNRRHTKMTYGPQELLEKVHRYLDDDDDDDDDRDSIMPTPSVCFRTIEAYSAMRYNDELFSCELDSESNTHGKWLSSNYWKSKPLWQKSVPIPELGERDHHESDTDEENPVFKPPRPPPETNHGPGSAKSRKRRRAKERKRQKLKDNTAAAVVS
jgi:hypothetical protein